jgi:thiamine biosynthesis protein ThiS
MGERTTLTINGESRELDNVATLADVLDRLGLDPRTVVVEHNRAIIRRPSLTITTVAAGDSLEIVHFVGGG